MDRPLSYCNSCVVGKGGTEFDGFSLSNQPREDMRKVEISCPLPLLIMEEMW